MTSEPTPAEIVAAARAERERAAKDAAARWEAVQAAQHAELIEAAQREMQMQAEIAMKTGAFFPSDFGRGSIELPTIDVDGDTWTDLAGALRGRRRLT
jgi:hypothetical protein